MSKLADDLIHQFADPFAFYRELVQNSLDAGSARIEVTLRYLPGSPGVATASVADWGEGMTRDTIERYLLTKFRSSKAGDLTKIGKFGVGFMSVLAPAPQLVVIDTGRDGEDWRVLLNPDLSYELRRAPEPVEGTRVTLHKEMTPAEYRDFASGSERALRRWCKHADADITFAAGDADGGAPGAPEAVREPFTVDAPYQVEHREEGTWIVAGVARGAPTCGFFNRGLTLLESDEAMLPGVSFKIQSRYLEHTLTRDNVRRDKGFERAMKLLRKLYEGPLMERLPGELRAAAERDSADVTVLARHALATGLNRQHVWFPLAAGGAIDGRTLRRQARRDGVVHVGPPGALAAAVPRPAVLARDVALPALLEEVTGCPALDIRTYTLAQPASSEDGGALCAELLRLARAGGASFTQCVLASVTGGGAHRVLVRVGALGVAEQLPPDVADWSAPGGVACLNAGNERVRRALALARVSPGLAALLLARMCAAEAGVLDDEHDRVLTEAALV